MISTKQVGMHSYLVKVVSFSVICSQFLLSCINNIPGDAPEAGDIPISLSTSFNSRVTATDFEENDAIGLYIMVQPTPIEKTRYIDNMKFTYNALNEFTPAELIFYPEGNNKCDFISYYPYQKNAANKGESRMKVEVKTDQSSKNAFSASDFMVATTHGVTATEDPVALTFLHKLFRINIQLEPVSGYTLEMLMEANPTVKIKDVYTKGYYDLNTGKFTDLSEKGDIIPHGSWTIENEMLCGKSAIIIPQTIPQSHIMIELYIEDRLFECELEKEHVLVSGIAEDNTITLLSSSDAMKNTITTSISDWISQQNNMTANETGTAIHTSQLDFTDSSVLKVMNKEKQVAEICQEYLCSEGIEKQAIVAYPTINGKTDLTKGTVIKLIDETQNKHGGSVAWNKDNNSMFYTEGTSDVIQYVYVTEDGEIKTSRPVNALQLQLKPDLLVDNRGNKTVEYPVVKIGTQYWLRINFKSTLFSDGTNIEVGGKEVDNTTPQHHNKQDTYFFYNATCIVSGDLIPYGWRVGNETDYTRLKTYIKNNAAVLKNGTSWKNNIYDITNLTGFNAVATGYYHLTYGFNQEMAAYWCASNDSPYTVNKMVTLSVSDNKVTLSDATTDMALIIKCIRN